MKFKLFFYAAIALIAAGCSNETVDLGDDLTGEPEDQVLQVTA